MTTDNNTIETTTNEGLGDKARRLSAALKSSDTGPLVIAQEVMDLAADWREWEKEASGMTADGWCRKALNHPLKFFQRRAYAVHDLGPASKRMLHHEAAVWLCEKQLPEDVKREAMKRAVSKSRQENGHALNLSALKRLLVYGDNPLLGRTPRGTVCAGCVMLEIKVEQLEAALKLLRDGGIDVDAAVERAHGGDAIGLAGE